MPGQSKKIAAANGKKRPKKSAPKPLDSTPKTTKIAAANGKRRPAPKKNKSKRIT